MSIFNHKSRILGIDSRCSAFKKAKSMNKIIFLLLSILIISCNDSTKSEIEKENIKLSELETFQSKSLKKNIQYKIILPENLEIKKDSLSLLVLLDGDDYSGIAKNLTSLYEFGDKISPTVIISLPSTRESRWTYYTPTKDTTKIEKGFEDLYSSTGKFDEFADFVHNELIPSVEEKYKINFNQKTIFGHSLGGLGSLSFAVLRPEIFDNYIAASPSTMYDQHFIFKTIEKKGNLIFNSMFLTAGLNDANGYRENVEWLKKYLSEHKSENQKVGMKIYDNENHSTSGLKSLIDGIEFIGK
ncbi:alpha/beta hydrolase [Mesonia aquimarina]|uniref:alpha/beta hydrolase n=1 Tax=Mesonia aquimarina TaxID=1504967 RepID=UPI000EF5BE16|nr:alpha/beta hydrolase-fold protein [Mesonia aquimarina]